MARSHQLFVFLAIVVVTAGLWLASRTQGGSQPVDPLRSANATSDRERSPPSNAARPLTSARAAEIFPLKIGDALHNPRNEAEVDWLIRHGYTSRENWDAALNATPDRRQINPQDGASPTEVLIASRLALESPHDVDFAVSFLEDAAMRGSNLALEELGAIFGHEALLDPVQSEAYLRARALRGDWTESLRPRRKLSQKQDMQANLMAHQIIENISKKRAALGLPPLHREVRPGLDEVLQSSRSEAKQD